MCIVYIPESGVVESRGPCRAGLSQAKLDHQIFNTSPSCILSSNIPAPKKENWLRLVPSTWDPFDFWSVKNQLKVQVASAFSSEVGRGESAICTMLKLNCQACSKLIYITLLKLLKWLLIVDLGQNYGMLRLRVWDAEFWPCRKMDTGRCTLINISHNPGKCVCFIIFILF